MTRAAVPTRPSTLAPALSHARFFLALYLLGISLLGCTSITRVAQANSLDLLPSNPEAGIYLNPGEHEDLAFYLGPLVGLQSPLPREFDRITHLFLAQSPNLTRPNGQGGTLILVHGRFPGFLVEWIFGTRFGMRSIGMIPALEVDFPRHRVLLPRSRTPAALIQDLGESGELGELVLSLDSIVIFDEGAFGIYFRDSLLGSQVSGDFLGQIFGPAPWESTEPENRIGWIRTPLDSTELPFGLGGVDIDVTGNTEPREGEWSIRANLVHLGSPEDQLRNQRVFGSTLRLLTLGMATQGLLAQDPGTLRREAFFGSDQRQIPGFGLITLTKVDNLRILPAQIGAIIRTLTLFLEAP